VTAVPVRTEVLMGTLVTIDVIAPGSDDAIERAFGWFREIEAHCTRFDPQSELMRLTARAGVAVPVSRILFEAIHFALSVAEDTDGAFDPAVGHRMEARGFNREDRTRRAVHTPTAIDENVSYRDVLADPETQTITLRRPLVLDLGAVAKGLAVDAAARELRPFTNFAIDAGGDLYLAGHNAHGGAWRVGIRHPRNDGELIDSVRVTDTAVCTSGDYERPIPLEGTPMDGSTIGSAFRPELHHGRIEHHIVDPRLGVSPVDGASATVVAPTAMLADALATAAFVLGPVDGIRLLERHGVEGLIVTPALERFTTPQFPSINP
jgi:thiamine biosynthesis lipoprotein